jgi:hypothetical protein
VRDEVLLASQSKIYDVDKTPKVRECVRRNRGSKRLLGTMLRVRIFG